MIKIENIEVSGWEAAIRGMRNAKESWDKSDSYFLKDGKGNSVFILGSNDSKLMLSLIKAGSDERKFLRMIHVSMDITAGQHWWTEFDTYKVGTVRSSCSKMHKIQDHTIDINSFDHEGLDLINDVVAYSDKFGYLTPNYIMNRIFCPMLDNLRIEFNRTKDKKYWRALIELLPESYHIKATVDLNYENIYNMLHARAYHKLDEWALSDLDNRTYYYNGDSFCDVIVKKLPYSNLLCNDINIPHSILKEISYDE